MLFMLKKTTFSPKAKIANMYLRPVLQLIEDQWREGHSKNVSNPNIQLFKDTESGRWYNSVTNLIISSEVF